MYAENVQGLLVGRHRLGLTSGAGDIVVPTVKRKQPNAVLKKEK